MLCLVRSILIGLAGWQVSPTAVMMTLELSYYSISLSLQQVLDFLSEMKIFRHLGVLSQTDLLS